MLLSAVQPGGLTLMLSWPAVGGPLEFSMLHDRLIEEEGGDAEPFPPQWQTYSAADITWVQSSFKWQLGMAGMAWGNEPVEPQAWPCSLTQCQAMQCYPRRHAPCAMCQAMKCYSMRRAMRLWSLPSLSRLLGQLQGAWCIAVLPEHVS